MPSGHRPATSRTTAGPRPVGEIFTVWSLTTVASLLFAHLTAIGPVLVRLTGTHGVHLGDVVFLVLSIVVATAVTAQLVRQRTAVISSSTPSE